MRCRRELRRCLIHTLSEKENASARRRFLFRRMLGFAALTPTYDRAAVRSYCGTFSVEIVWFSVPQ